MNTPGVTYQLQYGHLHHTLVEVRWLVFDDLNCDNLVRLHVLAFHDLTKCSLTEDIENEVPGMRVRM